MTKGIELLVRFLVRWHYTRYIQLLMDANKFVMRKKFVWNKFLAHKSRKFSFFFNSNIDSVITMHGYVCHLLITPSPHPLVWSSVSVQIVELDSYTAACGNASVRGYQPNHIDCPVLIKAISWGRDFPSQNPKSSPPPENHKKTWTNKQMHHIYPPPLQICDPSEHGV